MELWRMRHNKEIYDLFKEPEIFTLVKLKTLQWAVHLCGTGGIMRVSHAAGPDSIPGRDKFPGRVLFRGFSSTVRQMSGSFRPQGPRISFGHHYHPPSFITGANDLRCRRALKPEIYKIYLNVWSAECQHHRQI